VVCPSLYAFPCTYLRTSAAGTAVSYKARPSKSVSFRDDRSVGRSPCLRAWAVHNYVAIWRNCSPIVQWSNSHAVGMRRLRIRGSGRDFFPSGRNLGTSVRIRLGLLYLFLSRRPNSVAKLRVLLHPIGATYFLYIRLRPNRIRRTNSERIWTHSRAGGSAHVGATIFFSLAQHISPMGLN